MGWYLLRTRFKSGQVLRVGDVTIGNETMYYLDWKGPDIGKFANIRQELNEEVTNGIANSVIMEWLTGAPRPYTHHEIIQELDQGRASSVYVVPGEESCRTL